MTRKVLVDLGNYKYEWVEIEPCSDFTPDKRNIHHSGKDPTIDQYISEKGAIFNHADNKYYTTKRSYMDSLKFMGKTIDDN
tara:strand:+ start:1114 stop:1356 length:243 start_codon:yes stop_codon:yes gene_type:complete